MIETLVPLLEAAVPQLSTEFREHASKLWHSEHLERLAERLLTLQKAVNDRPQPVFAEETTPPLEPIFAPWRPLLAELNQVPSSAIAYRVEATGLDDLLLLLGMRRTPGSVSGPEAIPPTTPELLRAAEAPHLEGELLTVGARAWSKHVPRSQSAFWGKVSGGASEQNRLALSLIRRLLREATWWNVYGHFQKGTVFEVRIPTGHGARWQTIGPVFIGFVEPFVAGGIEARERE